eukprot:m.1676558 g.1676558  ORF g.1676558 m.1676558 type:complete len:115 (-) comp190405_c0_seq1:2-346(-)
MKCPEGCTHRVCIDFRNGMVVSQAESPYNDEGYATPTADIVTRPTCHEVAVGSQFHDNLVPCLFHAGNAHPKFGKIPVVMSASGSKVNAFKEAAKAVSIMFLDMNCVYSVGHCL